MDPVNVTLLETLRKEFKPLILYHLKHFSIELFENCHIGELMNLSHSINKCIIRHSHVAREKQFDIFQRYFQFGCFLIEEKIKDLNFNILKYERDLYNMQIIVNCYNLNDEQLEKIPKEIYNIKVKVRNINYDNLKITEDTTVDDLIVNNLKMSLEEFNDISEFDLPIKFGMWTSYDDSAKILYKKFKVACFLIEKYFEQTLPDFQKCYSGYYDHFDIPFQREENKDPLTMETKKWIRVYKMDKLTQYVQIHFINVPDEIIAKIPKKILGIDIKTHNFTTEESKKDFSLEKMKELELYAMVKTEFSGNLNWNEFVPNRNAFITPGDTITKDMKASLPKKLSLFEKTVAYAKSFFTKNETTDVAEPMKPLCDPTKFYVTYYGNADDLHTVSTTDDTIIIEITQFHTKGSAMRYATGVYNYVPIDRKDYKHILFRRVHKINA